MSGHDGRTGGGGAAIQMVAAVERWPSQTSLPASILPLPLFPTMLRLPGPASSARPYQPLGHLGGWRWLRSGRKAGSPPQAVAWTARGWWRRCGRQARRLRPPPPAAHRCGCMADPAARPCQPPWPLVRLHCHRSCVGAGGLDGQGCSPPPWLSVPLVCRRVVVAGAAGVAVEGVHGGGHFAAGCLRAGSLETEGWWGTDQHLTHNATNQPPSALLPPSPSPPSLLIIKARQAVRTGR